MPEVASPFRAMKPQSDTEFIIETHELSRIYPLGHEKVVGLDRVNLRIQTGALAVLKGASGSGKSTLLALIAALDTPSHGELRVAGFDLQHLGASRQTIFRREVVGMVFQSFNLLPTLSVEENVCLPALLAGAPFDATLRRAHELMARMGIVDRRRHRPGQLSGGEMQRTAIARALINQPQLILADEPTGNLDSRNGVKVIELLRDLSRDEGRTVVIATHSDQADPLATHFIYLKDGTLQQEQRVSDHSSGQRFNQPNGD